MAAGDKIVISALVPIDYDGNLPFCSAVASGDQVCAAQLPLLTSSTPSIEGVDPAWNWMTPKGAGWAVC